MDFQDEIQTLKKRADGLQKLHAKVEAQLNEKKDRRAKILADLSDKNIDPDALPQIIKTKESQLQKKLADYNAELDRVEEEIREVQAKL